MRRRELFSAGTAATLGALVTSRAALAAAGLADLGAFEAPAGSGGTVAFGDSLPARIGMSIGPTRYVDGVNGSDSGDGVTEATAWRTLNKAFTSTPAGGTALVKNGSYSARIDTTGTQSGTSSAVKTLAAYPGHAPVFSNLWRPAGTQYWRLRGLTFTSVGLDTGLYAVGSTANLDFEQCTFRDCPRGSGAVLETTCTNLQFHRCVFSNNGRANTILDHGIYMKSRNSVIANCLSVRNSSYGVQLYPSARGCYVVNNTIVGNGDQSSNIQWTGGLVIAGTTSANNRVYNNVIAFNNGWGARSDSGIQGGNVFQSNLVYQNTAGSTTWKAGTVAESGTVNADPRFVNRSAGDYRLADGSPAIDRAVSAYAPVSDFNLAGRM